MFYVQRQALNRLLFQRATHTRTIVVLDTAWPWANEAYGLCRLCAYGLIVLEVVSSSTLQSQ